MALLGETREAIYAPIIADHADPTVMEQGLAAYVAPHLRAVARELARHAARSRSGPMAIQDKVFPEILAAFRERALSAASQTAALLMNVAAMRAEIGRDGSNDQSGPFGTLLLDRDYRARCGARFPIVDETLEAMTVDALRCIDQFFERLTRDWSALEQIVPGGLGTIERLRFYAGDPHNGGQSVVLVHGTKGAVVYKPRSLETDVAFSRSVEWLDLKVRLGLRHVAALAYAEYGWTSFVPAFDCQSAEEVELCFRRIGALIALIFVLGGADIHHENIICAGAMPYIVDAEALLHGPVNAPTKELRRRQRARVESLMNTCYLPCLIKMGEGGVDISGAGYREGQTIRLKRTIQPDDKGGISARPYELKTPRSFNTPGLGGQPTRASDHVQEIEAGFADAMCAIIEHRHEFLTRSDLLPSFASVTSRYIPRATAEYGRIARDALHPHACATRAKHDEALSVLAARVGWTATVDTALLAADVNAIRRGDIPFFKSRADSRSLWTSEGVEIRNVFQQTGLQSVEKRLRALTPAAVERDKAIIRLSFSASAGGRDQVALRLRKPSRGASADVLDTAASIGERLLDLSIEANGQLYWLGRSMVDERFTCSMIGEELYGGRAGIGVFLAELARATGSRRFRRAALRCLRGVRDSDLSRRGGLGAFEGPTGLAYAEVAITQALDVPLSGLSADLLHRACDYVDTDRSLDVIGGSAGALLVALGTAEITDLGEPSSRLAAACASHLINHAEIINQDAVAWRLPAWDVPLTGLAHGACGISLALAHYASHFDDRRAWKLALRGFRYAQASLEGGRWRDLRHPSGYMIAWCHGAAGMTLVRQRLLELAVGRAPAGTRGEIKLGLKALLAEPSPRSDTFCHGKAGNWEALWRGGRRQLLRAEAEVQEVCQLWTEHGALNGDLADPTPDLMNGLAGVGLQLLRHRDRTVPCLALLGLRGQ